jgi:hypothetical protein
MRRQTRQTRQTRQKTTNIYIIFITDGSKKPTKMMLNYQRKVLLLTVK